ncbi:MAG: hypothetical protein HQM15_05465 [Deltaproteobacteria bacterium]|nr:hypothetical protein [Deltaproteobacteria bacterium]
MKQKLIGCAVLVLALLGGVRQGFARPGDLDTSFGSGGLITQSISIAPYYWLVSAALQADGKYLVAGESGNTNLSHHILQRYNPDGSLDSDFGVSGSINILNVSNSVTLQPDGKILIQASRDNLCLVERFNSDGSIDPGFGIDGLAQVSCPSTNLNQAYPIMTLQRDGKILLHATRNSNSCSNAMGTHGTLLELARLNANGSLDTTFGAEGYTNTCLSVASALDLPKTITELTDGKLLVAGGHYCEPYLIRYNPDGSLDRTFASSSSTPGVWIERRVDLGRSSSGAGRLAKGVGISPEGKVTIAYSMGTTDGNNLTIFPTPESNDQYVNLYRYNPDGSPDNTFGESGLLRIQTPYADIRFFSLQNNQKMLLVGRHFLEQSGNRLSDFTVMRLNVDGSFDSDFGTTGKVTTDFGGNLDFANGSIISSDNCKLTVVGSSFDVVPSSLEMSRYLLGCEDHQVVRPPPIYQQLPQPIPHFEPRPITPIINSRPAIQPVQQKNVWYNSLFNFFKK